MLKNKKLLTAILFYGALWGVLEASLGHVLHFIPASIAGTIMFPIASMILIKAYNQTNSKKALFYIGVVAASIKAVDIFLPAISIFKTINPMMSILLESLAVIFVISMVNSKKQAYIITALPIASISWRIVFVGWMGLQYVLAINMAPYLSNLTLAYEFVIVSGLVSGLIATGLLYLSKYIKPQFSLKLSQKPILASLLFLIALVLTYTL